MHNITKLGVGLLLLLLIIPPLFLHLGALPIQLWDEARIAVSAQEMMHAKNLLVVHYAGKPDMWSVKPPFMIWLQALSMHIWGMHEWATRLPAALASVCICLTLCLFFAKKNTPLMAFIAVAVLITSPGFITLHCSRTGDYDALLTCFTTAYCLCFFVYLQNGTYKYLYATFAFLTLAAFTKGVAALLFLPALFLFTLYKKQLITLLKNKHFYIGLTGFIVVILGYYLLREHYNPGYVKAVQQNELGGRYTKALEHNKGVFLYYFNTMVHYQFSFWYLLLIPGVLAGLFMAGKCYRDLTIYLLLLVLVFFFVISSAQTKLYWYAMPMYPFLSALAAFTIYYVFRMLQKTSIPALLPYLIFPLVFIVPYRDALGIGTEIPNLGAEGWNNAHMAEYLQQELHNKHNTSSINVAYTGYQANLEWYMNALAQTRKIEKNYTLSKIRDNEKIVVFQDSVKKYVETHYQTTILQTYYNVTVYQLNGTRQ